MIHIRHLSQAPRQTAWTCDNIDRLCKMKQDWSQHQAKVLALFICWVGCAWVWWKLWIIPFLMLVHKLMITSFINELSLFENYVYASLYKFRSFINSYVVLIAHKLAVSGNERNINMIQQNLNISFYMILMVYILKVGNWKMLMAQKVQCQTWRSWSIQRAGFSIAEFDSNFTNCALQFKFLCQFMSQTLCFAVAETVPTDDRKMLEDDSLKVEWSTMHIQTQNSFMSHNGMKESFADKSQRHLHLQHLEADLSSALWLVRSRANGVVSHKVCHVFLHFVNMYNLFVDFTICAFSFISHCLVFLYLSIWDAISLHSS